MSNFPISGTIVTTNKTSLHALGCRRLRKAATLLVSVMFIFFSATAWSVEPYGGTGVPWKEHVVLLHGIGAGSWHVKPLVSFLTKQGYDVINIDYPSTKYPLENLIKMEREVIKKELAKKKCPVHFVGHSMGGLMIRGILKGYKPKEFGRVVMLGTPNHGSEYADLLKDTKPFQLFFGPAGQQLTTNNTQVDKMLGLPDFPFGVIAGITAFDPTAIGSIVIPGPDDSMVGVESAKLEGMDDFIVINNSNHIIQPMNEESQKQIAHYLKYGAFNHKGESIVQ